MHAILRWLYQPLYRFAVWIHEPGNEWKEVGVRPPVWQFGPGSRQRFSWYFEGESTVRVSSVEEIVRWLNGCRYVADEELFQVADFWQHPRTFERLREGDCEDFALWAWRKLNELGVPARFFVGKLVKQGRASLVGHAWVVFTREGEEFLLESVNTDGEVAVFPLAAVRHQYRPHFSVDASYRTRSYEGFLTSEKEAVKRRRQGEADSAAAPPTHDTPP